jgi:hypothetical protein
MLCPTGAPSQETLPHQSHDSEPSALKVASPRWPPCLCRVPLAIFSQLNVLQGLLQNSLLRPYPGNRLSFRPINPKYGELRESMDQCGSSILLTVDQRGRG